MKYSLIDTVKFSVEIDHANWINKQAKLYTEDVINPITKACSSPYHNKKLKVPGAYGSAATVWSKRQGSILLIECSAAKFLSGQNVFGDDDLSSLITNIVKNVCLYLGITPKPSEKLDIKNGYIRLFRVDLVSHIKLPAHIATSDFIHALKSQLVFTQRSFSTYGDETIYIDQSSDMKTLKFYDKWKELKIHKLPTSLPDKELIKQNVKHLLRIEMTFRNRFLKNHEMSMVSEFNIKHARRLMKDAISNLNLTNQSLRQGNFDSNFGGLKNCLLALNAVGVNLNTIINNRQLKEHSKEILKKTGINILVPMSALELPEIPVKRHLETMRF
ncbi:phage/plasmid replication protein, II/X family [Comamonas sp. 26]|uniref:phage/plasmid replication protein, II/X family n=1 Tax=Comamonas sp. 26 TaxID=2035201 RepID=UPI000C19681D|nr:phage/plasmid replication protein, II/X family [Comamonas sp. 26]PIG08313.1 II/X family phage/plasmid replication protein [Comamonas sp. 26]